jgi:hypothetical protein
MDQEAGERDDKRDKPITVYGMIKSIIKSFTKQGTYLFNKMTTNYILLDLHKQLITMPPSSVTGKYVGSAKIQSAT